MTLLIDIFKTLRLSSPPFVLAVLGLGVGCLLVGRLATWGRRSLVAVFLAGWFLSTPVGAELVSAPFRRYPRIERPEQVHGVQAVVVLGAGINTYLHGDYVVDDVDGETLLRVMEAARIYKLIGDPLVIASGGNAQRLTPPRSEAAAMRQTLVSLGVPVRRIQIEDRSMTTHDQATLLKPMLAKEHVKRFVLVTSPTHMGRSLSTFRGVGLDPIPSVAALRRQEGLPSWKLLPDSESLAISDAAIYNGLAWGYYWARGLTRSGELSK